jgi:hypothetical protein
VLLPIFANLIAFLLPILALLTPVARGLLTGAPLATGKLILKSITALFRRPIGRRLAGTRSALAQTRQRGWALTNSVGKPGARYGAGAGGRQVANAGSSGIGAR